MSDALDTILLAVLVLATSVWVGGFVTIVAVSRSAAKALEPAQRIAFFRSLGRSSLKVNTPALLIAYITGAALLRHHRWDATLVATVVVAALLLVVFLAGVAQARHMTRLRTHAMESSGGNKPSTAVRRGSHVANALRGSIGVLSIALVVLGSILAL